MDEEDRIFYESELDVFGERGEDHFPPYQPLPLVSNASQEPQEGTTQSLPQNQFRAYNPLDRLRDMP